MTLRGSNLIYIPALAACGVTYSALFPVNKMSAESGTPHIGYVFWFSLFATLAMLVVGAIRRELPKFTYPYLRAYVAFGALGVAIPVPLLTFVAPKLPVGIITLLLILVPLITYFLSYLLGIERIRATGIIGISLGLAGMLLVLIPDVSLPSRDMVGWVLLALIAPVCFASVNAFAAYFRPPDAPSLTMAIGMSGSATILLVPVMLGTGQAYLFPGPAPAGNLAVLYAAAISASVTTAFFALVRIIGGVYFSQFNYFIVLSGFGWGFLLYGERHSIYVWIATALTFLGLAVFTRGASLAQRATAGSVP
jgi:drug/metabolite transporter (DMT)-like permease